MKKTLVYKYINLIFIEIIYYYNFYNLDFIILKNFII